LERDALHAWAEEWMERHEEACSNSLDAANSVKAWDSDEGCRTPRQGSRESVAQDEENGGWDSEADRYVNEAAIEDDDFYTMDLDQNGLVDRYEWEQGGSHTRGGRRRHIIARSAYCEAADTTWGTESGHMRQFQQLKEAQGGVRLHRLRISFSMWRTWVVESMIATLQSWGHMPDMSR